MTFQSLYWHQSDFRMLPGLAKLAIVLPSSMIARTKPVPGFPMSPSWPDPTPSSRPPVAPVLIGPVITAISILGMLVVARFYDRLPLQAPACGLRTTTGIPCVACGGTRSMMALAHGDFLGALSFNPLAFLGVIAAGIWLLVAVVRVLRPSPPRPPQPRRLPIWAIVVGLVTLFAANWVYLWLYLPK